MSDKIKMGARVGPHGNDDHSFLARNLARIAEGGLNESGYAEIEKLLASRNWQGDAAILAKRVRAKIDEVRGKVGNHAKNALDNAS